jgi:carboxyl-terminal processing protease
VRVANSFLQRGQMIVSQKGRFRDSSQPYPAINENPDNIPLVVLVNGESASASEILAGALQDHDRALIVGETTFGKGLVQFPFQLDYDSALLLTIAKYYTPSGRLIQRDYSNGGYNYYFPGGLAADKKDGTTPAAGPESHTDMGRAVYGGGGISPDEVVKPTLISPAERHLWDLLFGFSLELTQGRVAGFENYKIAKGIDFDHELVDADFPVTDALFKEVKKYAASKPAFKVTPDQLDKSRNYAELRLRYNVLCAAYGFRIASQVFHEADGQILRSLEAMPRARELALAASRARARG